MAHALSLSVATPADPRGDFLGVLIEVLGSEKLLEMCR